MFHNQYTVISWGCGSGVNVEPVSKEELTKRLNNKHYGEERVSFLSQSDIFKGIDLLRTEPGVLILGGAPIVPHVQAVVTEYKLL